MTTEQEIVETCICHKVRMAARAVTRAYDEALRPIGLRSTQFLVLVAIGIDGAISITELATCMGMDRTTLTRNLGPLHKDKLVIVGREGWRRRRTLEITERGRARLQEAIPLWEHAQRSLEEVLGDARWSTIHRALEDLAHSDGKGAP